MDRRIQSETPCGILTGSGAMLKIANSRNTSSEDRLRQGKENLKAVDGVSLEIQLVRRLDSWANPGCGNQPGYCVLSAH